MQDTTAQPLKWEALKCVIRGTLISEDAHLKKEHSLGITRLIQEVHALELAHKRTLVANLYHQLKMTLKDLLQLFDQMYY